MARGKSIFENHLPVKKVVKKVYNKSKVIFITTTLDLLILVSGIENVDVIRWNTLFQVPDI